MNAIFFIDAGKNPSDGTEQGSPSGKNLIFSQ